MKKFILASLFLHFFFFSLTAYGDHKRPKSTVCIPVRSLSQDPVAKSLRKTLNQYAQREGDGCLSADHFGITPYLSLFGEKFIVLQIQEGDFGGYWLNIISSPKKMVHLRVWIYDIDEDEYEIRLIERIKQNNSDRKSWEPLRSKEYLRYWI